MVSGCGLGLQAGALKAVIWIITPGVCATPKTLPIWDSRLQGPPRDGQVWM